METTEAESTERCVYPARIWEKGETSENEHRPKASTDQNIDHMTDNEQKGFACLSWLLVPFSVNFGIGRDCDLMIKDTTDIPLVYESLGKV